jgi:Virulence factor
MLLYDLPGSMIQVRVLYWQDIPSLIRVTAEDGTQVSRQLPDRFQQEIDRVAMAQGLIGSDAYLEQWEWRNSQPREGSLNEALDAIEAELTKPGSTAADELTTP